MTRPVRNRSILAARISALLVSTVAPLHAATAADWNVDAAGSWGVGSNWSLGLVPNGVDDVANLTNNISAARTVTLDGTRVVGTLKIGDSDNSAAFTVSGVPTGGSLTFDVSAGNALMEFSGGAAITNTLNVPIVLNDNLRIAVTAASTGSHVINGVISGAQSIAVDANGQTPANGLGQISLAGFNTFSGGLTTTQVRVQALNSFALGTGLVTANNSGQIYTPNAVTIANNLVLTGLGWQEATGLLGALRSDQSSTFNGNIAVARDGAATTTRFNTHATGTIVNTINGVIGGDASVEFTKSNAGGTSTWVLANANTYTGSTTIGLNAGGTGTSVLQIGNGGTTGSLAVNSVVTIEAGGVLAFNRRDQYTFTNIVSGAGSVTMSGAGTVMWDNGFSGYSGATTVSGTGRLVFGNGGAYGFGGAGSAINLSGGGDLEFLTTSNITLNGAITGTTNSYLINSGNGTLAIAGGTDNPGARVMVNGGTIVLGKGSAAAVHSVTAAGDFGVVVNGGTVRIGGSGGDQIQDGTWVQINGGNFDLAGQNESIDGLTGNGGGIFNSSATASTLTVGASNATSIVLAGVVIPATYGGSIQNGVGTVGLTKIGTGLQTLAGTNTYTGPTIIYTGVLSVTGSLSLAGTVAVNNGGTLSGTGSVGTVTMAPGSFLRPGATNTDDSKGTLTVNNLRVTGGDIRFNLGDESDSIFANATVDFSPGATVNATFSALPATTTLITATNLTGTLPTLTAPAGARSTFSLNNTGTALVLQVTGAPAQALVWSGNIDGNWNLNTTSNFNGGAERFFTLDGVTFGDGPTNRAIALAANLTPSSVTVNNSTGNDYIFQTGSITGAGGITKSGNGVLIVNTANSFAGDVNITGGILRAGNAAALGDANGRTLVSNGGTLDINGQNLGAERIFLSGAGVNNAGALINAGVSQNNATRFITLTDNATIGGANRFDLRANGGGETLDLAGFTLTKNGAGQFSVVAGRITDGDIVVNQGLFSIETSSVVQGLGSLTWHAGSSAQFWQTQAANITRPITFAGATITNGGQASGVGSHITFAGDNTFNVNSSAFTLTGSISESGDPRALTKTGDNTLILAGHINYTGATNISGGTLQFGNNQATSLPATSSLNFNGGTISYNVIGSTILPTVNFAGGGGTVRWAGATQDSTLTINGQVGTNSAVAALNITSGTANLEGGANVAVQQVLVGFTTPNSGNVATLNILPDATVNTQFFRIGENSGFTGFVNQTGGTVTITGADTTDANGDGPFRIGHWPAQGSKYAISGGTLNIPNGSIDIGTDGNSPILEISGTAQVSAKRMEIDARGVTGPIGGFLYLKGGSLTVGDGGMQRANNGQGNSSVNLSGGVLRAGASSTWAVGLNFDNQATIDTGINNVLLSGEIEGPGSPTKIGAGTLAMSSPANNFGGALSVAEGTLVVLGAMTGPGTTTMASGTLLVGGGNGTTSGRVNNLVLEAGSAVRPGANALDATVGTLTATNLNFNGATGRFTLNPTAFDIGGTANDLINVSGNATITGGTITPVWNSTPNAGTYTLINAGSLTVNTLPALDAAAASRQTYTLASTPTTLTLTVAGAAANLVWSGGLSGNAWDLNTTANWKVVAPNDQKFFAYDNVTFDDSGAVNTNVVLNGTLLPGSVMVNSSANYTLGGTGGIAGGSLTKSGAGTLTLDTNNSYPGSTIINAGTVRIGTGGAAGSLGTGPVTNDGTLIFDRSVDLVAAHTIGGLGSLVKSNTNTLTLNGAGAYAGGTTISKGSILIGTASAVGTGSVVLGDAGTGTDNVAFLATNNAGPANSIQVTALGSGTATIGTTGGTAGTTFAGPIVLQRPTTFQGQDTNFTGFAGQVTGSLGLLTISGGRRVILQNAGNDFVGDIVIIGAGTSLQAALGGGQAEVIPNLSNVTVNSGTVFQLGFIADGTESINGLNGAGTVQLINATGGTHTLALGTSGGGGNFTGVVQNGAVAPLSINKLGAGTQVLGGNVNSTGSITITEGVLAFGAAFGAGATKAALTTDTALDNTLTVAANVSTADLVLGMSVTGTGVPAGSRITAIPSATTVAIAGTQTATLAGNLTFGAAPLFLRGGTFRYTGAARTDDRLIDVPMTGGTLEASGSGALTLSATTLQLSGLGARILNLAGTSTAANALAAVITDAGGTTGIVKAGTGTWVLTGAGSTYTGGVTVNEGVLRLGTANKALGDNFAATINSGGTIDVNGQSGAGATRRYDLLVGGTGAAGLAALWNSGAAVVNNPIFRSITLTSDTSIGGVNRYDLNGGTVDGGGLTFNGGTNALIKVGTNELWWSPNGGATVGDIVITAGRFGVQSSNNLGSLTNQMIVMTGGQLSTYSNVSNAKPITLNGGQLHNNSAGGALGNTGTWTGAVTLNAAPSTINTDNGTTVGGPIVLAGKVTGPGGFEKTGAGFRLELSAPDNDWSGDTKVSVGTLSVITQGALSPNTTLDMNGGTVNLNSTLQTVAGLKGATGSISGGGTLTVNQVGNTVYGGGISGATNLTKDGTGTLGLSGAITSTGGLRVNNGVLNVNGSVTGTATAAAGGRLGGTGTIGGLVLDVGGTVSAGETTGVLTAGNADFLGGAFAVELNGTTAGLDYDQLKVTSAFTLSVSTELVISLGYAPALNDSFTLIDNAAAPTFSSGFTVGGVPIADEGLFMVGGQHYRLDYTGGADSNDIVLTAVPEPGSAVLLLGGLVLCAVNRRSRLRK